MIDSISRIRILPLLILVSILALVVRFGEVITGVETLDQAMSTSVQAQDKDAEKESEKIEPASIPLGAQDDHISLALPDEWADPSTTDVGISDSTTDIFKELAERRKSLEDREKKLNQREALLAATSKQIESKVKELTQLRGQIELLLDQQGEKEEARLRSLVKIYEGMKAKDAATIFNTLDMRILLQVVSRMSERKTAPIFAQMDPERARKLTILLAEQIKLPDSK